MRFTILNLKLPSLNEIIKLNKQQKGRYSPYNDMKQKIETFIHASIRATLKRENATEFKVWEGAQWTFTWHHTDKRTDPDNMSAGQKFIFDAFVKSGVLPNDNHTYISEIIHRFIHVPEGLPCVCVEISQQHYNPRQPKTLQEQLQSSMFTGKPQTIIDIVKEDKELLEWINEEN